MRRIVQTFAILRVSSAFSTSPSPLSVSTKVDDTADAVICGGGPAGLLSAIMLAQKFPDYTIKVYDRQPHAPPSPSDERVWKEFSRFYLIGLGGRGITSLETFGVWDDVKNFCVEIPGRMDWTGDNEEPVTRMLEERNYGPHVLPRDKLVSVLNQHILDNYSGNIDLNYGCEVKPVDFGHENDKVIVEVASGSGHQMISSNLVIASDGTARTFANKIEEEDKNSENPFSVVRYDDDNQRVYKIVDFKLALDWRNDLNYAVRTKNSRVIFDALPASDDGDYCGNLLFRKDDEMAQPNIDPAIFREFLNEILPQFSPMFDDETVSRVARAPPSMLPMFRYVTPRIHHGKRCILLGDCAHTVKPYFGLGCNSALEDVKLLGKSIDTTSDVSEAILKFSKYRSPDIERLVKVSHSLDKTGIEGVFSFLIPIILDGIFHKIAPNIFSQNVIAMLQREDMTFQEVVDKKRMERIGQLSILGLLLTALTNIPSILLS